MSKIYIDIDNAREATNSSFINNKNTVSSISTNISASKRNIYYKVLEKNDILERLNSVYSELLQSVSQIQRLYCELNKYLDSYEYTERNIASSDFDNNVRIKSANEIIFDNKTDIINNISPNIFNIISGIISDFVLNPKEIIEKVFNLIFNGYVKLQEKSKKQNKSKNSSEVLPSLDKYDLINEFMVSRNLTKDAIIFALSRDLTEGIESMINKWLNRDDMSDEAFKNQIKTMLEQYKKDKVDVELEKNLLEALENYVVDPVNGYNDIYKAIDENGEKYKHLKEFDSDSFDKIGKLLKYGQDGVEVIEILFNDYSDTIEMLENMKKGLKTVNGDETTIRYIDEMINEYKSKFNLLIDKTLDEVVAFGIESGIDFVSKAVTGGLLSIADFVHGIIWETGGITSKGDTLASIYASSFYSDDIVKAYNYYAEKLRTENYTQDDYNMCKTMFELAKATRIQEYENMKKFSTKETCEYIEKQLQELYLLQWNF